VREPLPQWDVNAANAIGTSREKPIRKISGRKVKDRQGVMPVSMDTFAIFVRKNLLDRKN
jgi:hypothetical protein